MITCSNCAHAYPATDAHIVACPACGHETFSPGAGEGVRYPNETHALVAAAKRSTDPGWRYVPRMCDCGGWHLVYEYHGPSGAFRDAMCSEKRPYYDEQVALLVARRRSTPEQPLRVYACGLCGAWHLTKQPAREEAAR